MERELQGPLETRRGHGVDERRGGWWPMGARAERRELGIRRQQGMAGKQLLGSIAKSRPGYRSFQAHATPSSRGSGIGHTPLCLEAPVRLRQAA